MPIFLTDISRRQSPVVEVDEYVPVTITWPGYRALTDSPSGVMLETGGCLLEVKVDRASGELVELVVVDARRRDLVQESAILRLPAFEPGVPCLDIGHADAGKASRSVARLHRDGLDVSLAEEEVVRWVGEQHCVMGFSASGGLTRLLIHLEPDEVELAFG
ncbi:hypothetical protein ACFUAG_29075 [Streptomyces sp. NPDC057193]|uniref:hypothetical protein n=1 Tax=Streptomyces sp. NPDC057193 TaxID=3346043 RepID=UPI00363686D4